MNHDERYKKLKENCRPIKLTRSISFTTISPAGEHMMGLGLDGISKGYILVFIGHFYSSLTLSFLLTWSVSLFHFTGYVMMEHISHKAKPSGGS